MEYKGYKNIKHKTFRVYSDGGPTIYASGSVIKWMNENPKCTILEYHVLPDSSGMRSYWIDILYSDWSDDPDVQ